MSSSRHNRKNAQEKIDKLIARARERTRTDPRGSRELAEEALQLAEAIRDTPRTIQAHQLAAAALERMAEFDEAIDHCRTAIRLCEEKGEERLLPMVLITLAYTVVSHGELDRGVSLLRRALEILERHDDPVQKGVALNTLGTLLDSQGDHVAALDAFMQALAIFEGLDGESGNRASCYNNIAVHSVTLGDSERAVHYFTLALGIHRENGNAPGVALSLHNLAGILQQIGREAEALPIALEALEIFTTLGIKPRIASTFTILAAACRTLGRPDESRSYYQRALDFSRETGAKVLLPLIFRSMAELAEDAGEPLRAIGHYMEAIAASEEMDDRDVLIKLYKTVSRLHEQCGQFREALELYRRYAELKEEIVSVEKQRAIVEMQTKYEATVLERENEIQRLRIEQLRQEVEKQNRDLAVQAMQLVQRNEYLERLEREVGSMSESQRQAPTEIVRRLRADLKPESDWETFMQRFRQVHPEFESKIAERYPALTPAELRVCALTRVGLSTKEIASLLYTSARTVENQRGSIRRKLGIPTETPFATFLAAV